MDNDIDISISLLVQNVNPEELNAEEQKAIESIAACVEEVLFEQKQNFFNIRPDIICKILEKCDEMSVENSALLISKFYEKYGRSSLCLLSVIPTKENSSKKEIAKICKSLKDIPIFNILLKDENHKIEGSSLEVNWEVNLNKMKNEIEELEKKISETEIRKNILLEKKKSKIDKIRQIYEDSMTSLAATNGLLKKNKSLDIYQTAFEKLEPLLMTHVNKKDFKGQL